MYWKHGADSSESTCPESSAIASVPPGCYSFSMIYTEKRDTVQVLRMEQGKVQAIDIQLLEDLSAELTKAQLATDTAAVVLTATGKVFSAGVDLFRLLSGGETYIREFLAVFHRFFRHRSTKCENISRLLTGWRWV